MMHSYSTDSSERRIIPFFIAGAAIGCAFIISWLFWKFNFKPPWWLALPIDTMALYGSFYSLFDHIIWKWKWVHALRISQIPDLSGEWLGRVRPVESTGVSAGLGAEAEITLDIKQTWTKLSILAQTTQSKSHSISGSIIGTEEQILSYEYLNEPAAYAPSTMHTHRGTARLIHDKRNKTLTGDYYSGRDRQNFGTLNLTRIK